MQADPNLLSTRSWDSRPRTQTQTQLPPLPRRPDARSYLPGPGPGPGPGTGPRPGVGGPAARTAPATGSCPPPASAEGGFPAPGPGPRPEPPGGSGPSPAPPSRLASLPMVGRRAGGVGVALRPGRRLPGGAHTLRSTAAAAISQLGSHSRLLLRMRVASAPVLHTPPLSSPRALTPAREDSCPRTSLGVAGKRPPEPAHAPSVVLHEGRLGRVAAFYWTTLEDLRSNLRAESGGLPM